MARHQYATKPPNISTMPPGVPYIIGNEAAERFSFYGMRSILIVFMTQYIVTSAGASDHMGDAEARQNFALFVAAVYFMPVFGAILAEGFIGKYQTIFWLSIVYCFGHFALAINDTRLGLLIGLGLISLGSGGIKPCVSANVGDQFGESNKHLLSKVFGWFYFSINAGSFISTLLCPWLLNNPRFGPRWAFGIPGVAMVIASIFFWAGRKKFVHIPPAGSRFLREFFIDGLGLLGLPLVLPALRIGGRGLILSKPDESGTIDLAAHGTKKRPSMGILILAVCLLGSFFLRWFRWDSGVVASGYQFANANPNGIWAWIIPAVAVVTIIVSILNLNNRIVGGVAGLVPILGFIFLFGARHIFSFGVYMALLAGIGLILAALIPPLSRDGLREYYRGYGFGALGRLGVVYIFVAVFWSLWDQSSGGSWTLQAQKMDLYVPWLPWINVAFSPFHISAGWGLNLIASQVQTANPILILVFIPIVNYGLYPLLSRVFPLTPLRKIGIGLFLTAGSYVVIWQVQRMIDGGARPNVNWQFIAYVILTLGEAMVSITGLEFSYTQAPNKMKSAVMALWLFTVSMGNLFTAGVNYFIRNDDGTVKMNDQQYFLFFAGLMLVAAVVFVVVASFYRGKTYLQSQDKALEDLPPDAATELGMP
jgi:dipeptide/tripeptide permease